MKRFLMFGTPLTCIIASLACNLTGHEGWGFFAFIGLICFVFACINDGTENDQ